MTEFIQLLKNVNALAERQRPSHFNPASLVGTVFTGFLGLLIIIALNLGRLSTTIFLIFLMAAGVGRLALERLDAWLDVLIQLTDEELRERGLPLVKKEDSSSSSSPITEEDKLVLHEKAVEEQWATLFSLLKSFPSKEKIVCTNELGDKHFELFRANTERLEKLGWYFECPNNGRGGYIPTLKHGQPSCVLF
jgi:hypothetical protein